MLYKGIVSFESSSSFKFSSGVCERVRKTIIIIKTETPHCVHNKFIRIKMELLYIILLQRGSGSYSLIL